MLRLTLTLLAVSPAAALAQSGGPAISTGKMLETILWLAVVLALIVVLARVLQRVQRTPRSDGSGLRVVNALNLGNREKVLLIEVADKHILVGSTPQAISTLHVFDDLPVQPQQAAASDFASMLGRLQGRAS